MLKIDSRNLIELLESSNGYILQPKLTEVVNRLKRGNEFDLTLKGNLLEIYFTPITYREPVYRPITSNENIETTRLFVDYEIIELPAYFFYFYLQATSN